MLFHNPLLGLLIIFGTPISANLNHAQTKACQAVFSPEAMKQSCCPPMDQFVERIRNCQKESSSSVFSCSVSKCVTTIYGITTNNKIDEKKCRALLKRLTKEDKASEPLNKMIEKNCLNGQYKKYVTSDVKCDTMKYQVCAYVNYLLGCVEFNKTPRSCKKIAKNVKTCKPVLDQYLKKINSKRCNRCHP
ncbi:uncharacterized protein LOC110373083 [Helicoverpa armigera]|uniref:uncharacterized protein LOC110373083 n=1 Tax=Helicoverpa armigera TaxID=29058 RepID=UPI0030838FB7